MSLGHTHMTYGGSIQGSFAASTKPFFSDIVHAHGMLHCLLNPLAAAGMDGEVRYYLCVDEHVPGVHFAAANVAPQEKPRAESSGDMRVSFITLQLSLKFSMGQFPLQKMGWCPPPPPGYPWGITGGARVFNYSWTLATAKA